jgi:cytosine/adenosine deaminase-related metal-dependent hydrolase
MGSVKTRSMDKTATATQLITAQWAVPVAHSPVENAALIIRDGLIENVCTQQELTTIYSNDQLRSLKENSIDYGEAVITPGLINLHTHLDYSSLNDLYNDDENTMFEWLPKLVQTSWSWSPEQWKASVVAGVTESLRSGTSCLVDNSFTGQSAKILAHSGVRAIIGLELFGQDESLAETAWQRWLEKYERVSTDQDPELQAALKSGLIQLTVAPHSPYTVAPALWKLASQWADKNNRRLLAHVSESVNECAWIKDQDEIIEKYLEWMRELQAKAGLTAYKSTTAPPTPWRGKKQTPCQLLDENGLLNQRLVATHVVQVKDEDLDLLKKREVNIVHCVRSNLRLKHGLAPLQKFRKSGIRVGLGTDSLASAPDLSMLAEAQQVIQLHSAANKKFHMGADEALSLITLEAAKVIGLSDKIGSLERGKIADLAIFQYGQRFESGPARTLFSERAKVVTVYIAGRIAHPPK